MTSLETFCEALYGNLRDYVYVPTKDPATGQWKQRWFKWPDKKVEMYEYITNSSRSKEVYIAPAMFTRRKINYESFSSSRVVWAEFDGQVPTRFKGIPRPNIRIQSSVKGHEHWYWILDSPLRDAAVLALVNKKLAYTFDADRSGWDVTQVLRPPATIHHESGRAVALLNSSDLENKTSVEQFAELKSHESLEIKDITASQLVDIQDLVAIYEWPWDTWDLFNKDIPPKFGKEGRSGTLTRLAFDCSEMGMQDHEIVTVLKAADDRWEKFTNRTDQLKQLTGIVRYVRSKKQIEQIKEAGGNSLQALGFEDFLRLEIKLDWIVKGILPVAGLMILFGAPGCGKTTLSLRTGMSVAKGESYLNWTTISKKRVLFISAEMPHEELNEFFQDMTISDTATLQENFFIYPIGHAFPLNNNANQNTLLELIDRHKAQVVILDSLSVVAGGSTNDDQTILNLNHWIDKHIRKDRGCSVIYLHHNRKPDKFNGDYQTANSLAQLYGSQFISAGALTVIGMERPHRDKAVLYYNKGRYFREEKLNLIATDDRDFEINDTPEPKARPDTSNSSDGDGDSKLFSFA